MSRLARVFVLFAGWLAAPLAQAQLRIVGTDLLGAEFAQALYAATVTSGTTIAVTLDGSRPGLERLRSGRAEVGLIVFSDETPKLPAELSRFVGAYHRIIVLAPEALRIEQISLDALARVFDGGATGQTMRWAELGVAGDEGIALVQPLAPEEGSGMTTGFFRQRVLRGRACAGERYDSQEALARRLSGEARVLALAPAAPRQPGVTVLAVAARAGEPAFLPTLENLHSGDYPLRVPVHVVYRRDIGRELRPLLRFLAGDAAADWERAGLSPLPAAVRAQHVRAFEKE